MNSFMGHRASWPAVLRLLLMSLGTCTPIAACPGFGPGGGPPQGGQVTLRLKHRQQHANAVGKGIANVAHVILLGHLAFDIPARIRGEMPAAIKAPMQG